MHSTAAATRSSTSRRVSSAAPALSQKRGRSEQAFFDMLERAGFFIEEVDQRLLHESYQDCTDYKVVVAVPIDATVLL